MGTVVETLTSEEDFACPEYPCVYSTNLAYLLILRIVMFCHNAVLASMNAEEVLDTDGRDCGAAPWEYLKANMDIKSNIIFFVQN